MKSLLCVFLLVLVLVEGCWKQEREALIALSWVNIGTDCCEWVGIECNTTTGRVTKIKLQSYNTGSLNYSDFAIFKDLTTLDLSGSGISNCTRTDQGLNNLEVLDLGFNLFYNAISILSCLDGLSSLKSLSLADTSVMVSFHDFQTVLETIPSKLLHLEVLDISYNNLSNEILPSLRGFKSLKELHLSVIGLDSDLHIQGLCAILKNLEILDLSNNNFKETDIASALSGLSSLKSLSLGWSQLTMRSIHNISKLRSLEILDLSWNNLGNNIFSSLNGLPRLKSLDLSYNNLNGSLDISGLSNLTSLKILDFTSNQLVDLIVREGSKNLSRLDILNLDSNMINGSNLQQWLWAFPSIRNLTLRNNQFKGTILDGDWSKLKKLEELDLSGNEFVGKLPSSFFNMTSLLTLNLSNNHFIGNIGPNLASFTSLEYLNFEGNQFEFPISFTQFSNHSNLKFIYGNGNKVILDSHSTMKTWVPKFQLQVLQLSSITEFNSIPLPNFLLYQYNLTYVDFTGCKLRGEFPNWLLENNTKMENLILQNCSFVGNFQLPSHPPLNMATIDVSYNAITGQMLSNNISSIFPNLVHLNMSRNAIHGSIPYELCHLSSLRVLDLSDNELSGEIPNNLSGDGSQLIDLTYLLLGGNSLSGSIPSNLFNLYSIKGLDLSNNNFTGKISNQIKNSSSLIELSMSNNHLEGSIPSEVGELESLTFLDLSQNNFSGCVPSFVNIFPTVIHLGNNKLSCLSKNMFGRNLVLSFPLLTLDLSSNEISNGIHDLIHDLRDTGLKFLLMKGNNFTGNIPKQLCHLTDLDILDLSYNNFIGEIPSCLGKMLFENEDPDGTVFYEAIYGVDRIYNRFGKERENFTSKKRLETYTVSILIYMSGIDLSHNKLNGSIPYELGNLTRIRALNLSNNLLTGKVPATFSNLVQVESLDLSFNMLSGQIPPQLSGLHYLEVFSVAHNNLSGATPEWKGQLSTFDESSYEGNQFLCGPPLPKSCNPSEQAPATLPNGLNNDGDNDIWVDMYVFRVSFVVAYTSIVLVIPIVLYINPYWRQAWFYYIGLVCMNCYYFIVDNLYKFFY
ncbi:receptor-like protein 56 isoform X2 [Medicago truncatula]|uniref:receptor-like protein 56 isoform X2 n=1 Tax=Medicago truncatula TaxID=3880 RepID=UPI000D2F1A93|nr:receptor-like protein 56 isoform X2 [Medicago truncatula]